MADELRITLIKSHIGRPEKHRAVLMGMGLNRVNKTVTLKDTQAVRGMVKKVEHLVKVEE